MSIQALKKFVVTGRTATINAGLVRLTAIQAKTRQHNLMAVEVVKDGDSKGAGVYEIKNPIQFKNGEQFEHDGEFPKSMADAVADPKETVKDKETGKTVKKATVGK